VKDLILYKEEENRENILHCAIDPNSYFTRSISNCSASGKKRAGMIMLDWLQAIQVCPSYSALCSFKF